MIGSKRIHDLVPDASPNEAIVTGGARTIGLRQVAPWCTRAQDPKDAFEHAAAIYTPNARGLFGSIGLMAVHSFASKEHGRTFRRNEIAKIQFASARICIAYAA